MNRDQFNEWLANPDLLGLDTLARLKEVVDDYPFFQTARLLYLLNLKKLNDYRFDMELRRMAIFSGDRARLRKLIRFQGIVPAASGSTGNVIETPMTEIPSQEQDERLKILEKQIRARLQEIEEKQSGLRQLMDEKEEIVSRSQTNSLSGELPGEEGQRYRALPKDDLLEEFIQERKGQASGQVPFYSPEESARRSIEENDDIISETLARLVAAQGKFDRAIKIYQQLMLKNPQKSSYFAAQIEKLRKEL
jgi:tetratricopeptide (TPR) repeat protein